MRRPLRLAVPLVVAMAIAGCNSGDDPAIDIPATSSTSAPGGSPTTAGGADGGEGASGGVTRPSSPEQAATGLFDAWQADDRERAGRFATPRAVDDLFGSGGSAEGLEYQGCDPVGAQQSCAWRYEGGALIMTVHDSPDGGFVVESVRFIVD